MTDAMIKQERRYGIIKLVDAGSGPGKLQIGTTGFAAVLGEIELDDVCGTVSGQRIKLSGFPKSFTGLDDGVAVSARLVDSDDNVVLSGLSVGLSSSDVLVESTSIATGSAYRALEVDIDLPDISHNKGADLRVLVVDPVTGFPVTPTTTDRELVVTTYTAKNAFTGASVGDIITCTQIIDVSATPSTVSTIWRNQTTAADLAGAPSFTNLTLEGTQGPVASQLPAALTSAGNLKEAVQEFASSSTTMQNAVSATGNGTPLDVTGMAVAVLQISGTFSATVSFEASNNGTEWFAINATQLGADALVTSTTATGLYRLSVAGLTSLRARVTWTSGTSVTVVGRATTADSHAKLVNVGSSGHKGAVTITRPANTTPYTGGDVIGDTGGSAIFTFANMARAAGEIIITSVEVEIDVNAVPSGMAGFNLRLYNASPTAIADNAAWDLPSGDRGMYLGKIALATPTDEGATLFSDNDGVNKQITLTSTMLYAELQTVGGFTPAANSEVYRLTIHTLDA